VIARLRLASGPVLYTKLDVAGDSRDPLVVLQDILTSNHGGWLGASPNASLKGRPRLVNTAQIVTAQLV
jgi:hypothetical protein